jgi:hypothetical protein
MNYDAIYFINKFSKITDELWGMGFYNQDGVCCALGHCGVTDGYSPSNDSFHTPEADALRGLFGIGAVDYINDGLDNRYPQSTPKARILAALEDVKNGTYRHRGK